MSEDHLNTVSVLLTEAGLDVPHDEAERLARLYGGLRHSANRFHRIATGDEVTAAVFRAQDRADEVDR